MLKRSLLFLLLCCSSLASATVAVTAKLLDGGGHPVRISFLQFDLAHCGYNVPDVPTATSSIVLKSFKMRAGVDGSVTGSVFGHDEIACGNSYSTLWHVTAFSDSNTKIAGDYDYDLEASVGHWELSSAQPFVGSLPPPGFRAIFGNPTQNQLIVQPSGTSLRGTGTFDFTGASFLVATPTLPAHAATKLYVDNGLATKADLVGGKVPQTEIATGDVTNSSLCVHGGSGFAMGLCNAGVAGDAATIQGNAVTPGAMTGRQGAYYAVNSSQLALALQDKNAYETRDYGIASDTVTNDTSAMSTLLTSIGSNQAKLVFPKNSQTLLANITFPSNVVLDFSAGGGLKAVTDTTPVGGGAIDSGGSGSSYSTSANSCAVTVTPGAAGRAYWIYTAHGFASGAPTQPTSSVVTDVIPVIPSFESNTNVSMLSQGWLVSNVAAGARTFTFGYAGTGWVGCGAIAISGLGPTPSVGVTASAQGTASPMSSGAATVLAGSFVLGYGGQHNDTETCAAGAGFTQLATTKGNFGASGTVCAEYLASSSAGSLTATQTLSSSPTGLAWTFNMVELHPGSATISIQGPIIAPQRQIFFNALGGQGIIDITGNTSIPVVYPEWFGAFPSASAATNTPALQAAKYLAFGTNRTNASGLAKYNRELHFSGNYQINDELQFYHVIGFRISCEQRLNGGITQTAANKRIIDGQSMAYGVFDNCSWATTAAQTVPLLDIDYSAAQGVDLAPQFIDFNYNTFAGNGVGQIGLLLAKSGGGAQGSNVNNNNSAYSGFTEACFQIGGNNTGVNTGRLYAQNALANTFTQGDIQGCPKYGIAVYGGNVFVRDTTFENGFSTQTGFDVYCEAPQAPGCTMDNVRSESRRLASGVQFIKNSQTINQASAPTPGVGAPVGTIITGSKVGGDGKYYQVTVDSSGYGGVGNYSTSTYESASSGSSTTIVNSGAAYTVSAFVGMRASIMQGTGFGEYCVITANTATAITCAAGWVTNYQYLTIVNPDNTSKFIVEPDWGTQLTSGGVTWVDMAENGIEGSAGAAGLFDLDNVKVPGTRIHMSTGRIRNLQVTRTDWCNCGFLLDDQTTNGRYEQIYVFPGGGASGAGPISVGGSAKYVPWHFPRNGSTQFNSFSQSNRGAEAVCWSSGGNGGGTRNLDVCIGDRGSDNAGGTSVSRNVLGILGMIGPKTPFGTDQAGAITQIQGGLSTGSGAPGDVEIWLAKAASTGTAVNSGLVKYRFVATDDSLEGPVITTPSLNPGASRMKGYFTSAGWCTKNSSGTEVCTGGSTGYNLIRDEGTPLTARSSLSFEGAGVVCADDSGNTRTKCTIAGTAGGLPDPVANGVIVEDGAGSTQARTLTAGSSKLSITNPQGIAGNPTFDVVEANIDATNIANGVTPANTKTLTNKTEDVEGTGNVFTMPIAIVLPAAGCSNATASPAFDLPSTSAAVADCLGTSNTTGVLDFADAATTSATVHFTTPSDWDTSKALDLTVYYTGDTASTSNLRWQVSTGCVADGETVVGPTYNTASAANTAGPATIGFRKSSAFTNVAKTNCAAGETMYLKVQRVGADVGDVYTGVGQLIELGIVLRRTM